jgi:hypothetical protein
MAIRGVAAGPAMTEGMMMPEMRAPTTTITRGKKGETMRAGDIR